MDAVFFLEGYMRRLFIFLLSVVGIILILFAIFYAMRAKVLSSILTKQLGTPVEITSIELSQNRVEVYGLSILTPEDPTFKKAFSMDYLRISASIFDLFKKTRQIQEIFISGIRVNVHMYNQAGTQTNWSKIINNMSDVQDVTQEKSPSDEARFTIRELQVQNATLALKKPDQNVTVISNSFAAPSKLRFKRSTHSNRAD